MEATSKAVDIEQFATGDLPAQHSVRRVQTVLDGALMGSFQTKVMVQPRDEGSLATPNSMRELRGLQTFLAAQTGVIKTSSVVDYLQEFSRQAEDGDDVATDPDFLAKQLAMLFALSPSGEVHDLLDRNGTWAAISIGTNDLGAERIIELEHAAQRFVQERDLTIRFTGEYWLVSQGVSSLVHDLIVSTLTSFILVFALVALFFRSWKLTVLTIPPNILPLAAALGLMGFAHLPLRVGTSLILPMSLGIAVNASIQLLARVRHEWPCDRRYATTIREALLGTGRGMLFSGLVLVIGFLAYLIPDFSTFRDIGLIASWTLLVALLSDLFLTPALVLFLKPLGAEKQP